MSVRFASLYDWLLFLHIVGAAIWLGGLVILSVLATVVLRSRDSEFALRFLATLRPSARRRSRPRCCRCSALGSGWSSMAAPTGSDGVRFHHQRRQAPATTDSTAPRPRFATDDGAWRDDRAGTSI